ncbi:copper amine oxidase N-terminal domain-containing protein [Petroclostridium sp. X23]|uniref:copper amine oxidase N-terminal domain-containing protein n=1 Tax=Petroclostridium sp. X23 TaxID=3045146 RepID=UPI0024ACDA7B|nr:copper amine oxidase N-terminal domain-containing protein [Petroclostridium sp. X23]WHH57395.1 copper amine oxidase N-terminal domain-containing protein [Petroclostridium sp. X23]
MKKKIISMVTVLALTATMLVPVAAFAATTNTSVGAIRTVAGTSTNINLADLRIDEGVMGNFADGDVIALTLPSGVKFNSAPVVTFTGSGKADFDTAATNASVKSVTSRVYNITIKTTGAARTDKAAMQIGLNVDITSAGTGDIAVNVAAPGTAITEGDVVVGRFVSGNGTVSVLTTPTKGGSAEFGMIRIVENAIGALDQDETIKIKLPNGYTWNNPVAPSATDTLAIAVVSGDGERTLELKVTNESTSRPAMIDIKTPISVSTDAGKGDITASFSGTAGLSDEVVVGTYADYGVSTTAKDAKEVTAGKDDQRVAEIVIEEGIANSLIPGRTITFTLPEGARFRSYTDTDGNVVNELPKLKVVSGDNGMFGGSSTLAGALSNSGRTMTYTLANTSSASAMEIEFNDPDVDIAANFAGELEIEVGGTAGATGDFVVADVKPLVTLESEPTDIKVGVQNQKVGDIIITEGAKEALEEKSEIVLSAPADVTFSTVPTVEVIEGNLEIDGVSKSGGTITIKVDTEGTKPSVIKVSGLAVTANRAVPEGEIKVSVKGSAVMQNAIETGSSYAFANVTNAGSVVVANVVTPAPDGVGGGQVVEFVLGNKAYTVDGVEKEMDVAAYVQNDRTMLPVRFVADALGVSNDNIIWNEATSQVTIIKDNRVAQMTIGSNILTINGTRITMDTTAVIKDGRTMLPIRFVGQALGATIGWNEATSTVTVSR